MEWHVTQILRGEYDVPLDSGELKVLDIGANVGAFTAWASRRWRGCKIDAYEPISSSYRILLENVKRVKAADPEAEITTYNVAVLGTDLSRRRMWLGLNNCGEASFHNLGEQSSITETVKVISARQLPAADVIKIDTEGCEVEILEHMNLSRVKAIMLEYHSTHDRNRIIFDLNSAFELVAEFQSVPGRDDRGILKFLRRSISI
jgi:FkbM family methyltransferase